MIIKTISTIKKIALSIFFATILLALLFYLLLSKGITIQNLYLPFLQVNQLYLKLDKKLIVAGENIALASTNKTSKARIDIISKVIEKLPHYFQHISLKDIHIAKQTFDLSYQKNLFHLKSKELKALFRLNPHKKYIEAVVEKFIYSPYRLSLHGRMKIFTNHIEFEGRYNIEGIEGILQVTKRGKELFIFANSEPFTNSNLRALFSHLHLHPQIKSWSYQKIRAKTYKFKYFKLHHNLTKPLSPNSFEALAIAKNVDVKFHSQLPPAKIQKVVIHYHNNRLDFKLFSPRYQKKRLDGSYVKISHIADFAKSRILIALRTQTMFDATIKQILKAYHIDAPIEQKNGTIDAKLFILLYFKGKRLDIKGDFFTGNSTIFTEGVKLRLQKARLHLHNKLLHLKSGDVKVADFVATSSKGFINFSQRRGKFFAYIKKASLQQKGIFLLQLQNLKEVVLLDIKKKRIHLKNLDIDIKFGKSKEIEIYDLSLLERYSPFLQKISPTRGNATILIQKNGIAFESTFTKPNKFFIKNGSYIENFHLRGIIAKTSAIELNDFLHATIDDKVKIFIKNVDINLTTKKQKEESFDKSVEISLQNSTLFVKNRPLKFDSATASLHDETLTFGGSYAQGRVVFTKRKNRFSLQASKLPDRFVNAFLQKNLFQGGNFSLGAQGEMEKFSAEASFFNTHIKNLKALNNIFAFINTVPALVTFNDPGFSTKGLYVKDAKIDFFYEKGKIFVKSLSIKSDALSFKGTGVLDLKKNAIAMQIKLITFKSVTNILNKIPLASYILLGKEGSIATTLTLSGSINNPKVSTHLTKETLQIPFNILKRTLQLPFKLFE